MKCDRCNGHGLLRGRACCGQHLSCNNPDCEPIETEDDCPDCGGSGEVPSVPEQDKKE